MNYSQVLTQQKLLKEYDVLELVSKGRQGRHPRLTYKAIDAVANTLTFVDVRDDGSYVETMA